jgi:CDP-glycerol glycerophosphotransferase
VVHADAYRTTVPRTSVAKHQDLLRDCTVWNKVYRRSFWDSARLEFWAARYEDVPVATRAYVLARSVDIRREIVYYWRARESGEQLSRVQRSRELANVEGRMAAVLDASGFIASHAPALKPAFDRRVLDNDLAVLVRAVEFASEPDRERLLELAAGYLSSVDDSVFRETEALAADSGGYAQRMLQEWYGSNVAGGRIDDLVVFDSHGGKQYSCNPRAIYEELRRRDTGLQCVDHP